MDSLYKYKIGQKLKQLRESHNYKQIDIAAAADIKQSTYSQYENGKRTPSSKTLYKIAAYYGIPVDDLMKYCIDLDDSVFFTDEDNKNGEADYSDKHANFIAFTRNDKYRNLSYNEKSILYYLLKLSPSSQDEVIEYAKFKLMQENRENQ